MQTLEYTTYYNSFASAMARTIRPGFGFIFTLYPYEGGTVYTVAINKNTANEFRRMTTSASLSIALGKTNMLANDVVNRFENKTIENTLYGIVTMTRIVVIKNDNIGNWSETAAIEDVKQIVKRVKDKYGKH